MMQMKMYHLSFPLMLYPFLKCFILNNSALIMMVCYFNLINKKLKYYVTILNELKFSQFIYTVICESFNI